MTNMEERIRALLEEDARGAPPAPERGRVVVLTRRRQARSIAGAFLGVIALAAVVVVGVRTVGTSDRGTPAGEPTETTTINGVSITLPESWLALDPDELGLNGPTGEPHTLPRLVLAVSPTDPGEMFGCPGLATGTPPRSLMTIQEASLALAGQAAGPWPVSLEPMAIESAGGDAVESGPGGCYPGWEFLRAGWTSAGRTFEARVGLAPDVSDEERAAVLDAFASMTFEPVEGGVSSAVLWSDTTGGEPWQLIASRGTGGLELTLQGSSFGTGASFDPTPSELRVLSHVIGEGAERRVVVFGAVPSEVDLVVGVASGSPIPANSTEVLDVPDEINGRLNAFLLIVDANVALTLTAYDAEGNVVLQGTVDPQAVPTPAEATPVGSG